MKTIITILKCGGGRHGIPEFFDPFQQIIINYIIYIIIFSYLCSVKLKTKQAMQATVFNPIQLHLLQMFSRMNSEQELKEVQQVLSEYYFKKVAKRANELWDEMELNDEKLEQMANIHERLPYK